MLPALKESMGSVFGRVKQRWVLCFVAYMCRWCGSGGGSFMLMRERPVSLADGGTIFFMSPRPNSVSVMPCVRSVGLRPKGVEDCFEKVLTRSDRELAAGGGGPSSRHRGVEENAR